MTNTPQHVLIIEDSALLREVMRDALQSSNFRVSEAENGKEGLEKALAEHPDLILLDLMMPVMDGVTTYKRLRQDAWGEKVPVIILTATKRETMSTWLSAEKLDFLNKDAWMADEVVTVVKQRLSPAPTL
jgi:CheY-like chemotaxis protein